MTGHVRHGRSRGVHHRVVVAPGERLYDRKTKRWHDNESRVEDLLEDAKRSGLVDQWDGSRGFFWWEGKPGPAMRALRNAIGGEPVRDGERIDDATRRVGNEITSIEGTQFVRVQRRINEAILTRLGAPRDANAAEGPRAAREGASS